MPEWLFDGTQTTGWQLDGFLSPAAPSFVPGGYKFEAYPGRGDNWNATTALAASGTVNCTPLWLPYNAKLTKGAVLTGTTAGATMTHQWLAILDNLSKVLATSNDATSGAIPANTLVPYTFNAGLTTPYTGLYFLAWMVAATGTMPTVAGMASTATMNGLSPILAGTSSTGQTTAPTVGNYLAAVTAGANFFYGCVG